MKRFLKIAAFAAALVFTTDFATAQSKIEDYPTVQFFAHRGSRFEYEENTMYAFETAYARGARGFETDVRMTGSGDLILSHDESLYRTCGVDVQTEDLTTKECLKIKTKSGNDLALCQELANFLASAGKDAVAAGVHAGKLVGAVAAVTGGKGGGRPDNAMAGGADASKVLEALASAEAALASMLK